MRFLFRVDIFAIATALVACTTPVAAFTHDLSLLVQPPRRLSTSLSQSTRDHGECDRRSWFATTAATSLGFLISSGTPTPVLAYAEEQQDKEKLKKGYERLSYLLDNWVKETTVCGKGEDNPYLTNKGCERTPLRVMDYMGYKSINDPLFKAEKTLKRLGTLVADENGSDYLEAVEKWAEAAEEASGMAFVSSWGEANPGGGKDRVQVFIERAKKNVEDAHDSLGTAIRLLNL